MVTSLKRMPRDYTTNNTAGREKQKIALVLANFLLLHAFLQDYTTFIEPYLVLLVRCVWQWCKYLTKLSLPIHTYSWINPRWVPVWALSIIPASFFFFWNICRSWIFAVLKLLNMVRCCPRLMFVRPFFQLRRLQF